MADPVFERVSLVLKSMAQAGLGSDEFRDAMSEVTPGPFSEMVGDLGMIKLTDRVEFVMALEDAFQISIPDEASDEWVRLNDVVECIKKIQKSK
jgi:acyl carrier protein